MPFSFMQTASDEDIARAVESPLRPTQEFDGRFDGGYVDRPGLEVHKLNMLRSRDEKQYIWAGAKPKVFDHILVAGKRGAKSASYSSVY
jgi:hypothetical protein